MTPGVNYEYMAAPLREQLQEYHYTPELNTEGKYCYSYYSRQGHR